MNILEETLPNSLRKKYKLINKKDAIRAMHFPNDEQELKQARRRFVYEEFLLISIKNANVQENRKGKLNWDFTEFSLEKVHEFIDSFPFPLTNAQSRVVNEILTDLKVTLSNESSLQGDVGSGKTAVAAIALFATVTAGFQGALMVPTEILAEQHVESLKQLFDPVGINCELLTSSVKGKRRKEILSKLKDGRHSNFNWYACFNSR